MLKREEFEEIVRLSQSGLCISDILRKTGRSLTTIYRILKNIPISSPKNNPKIPQKILNFPQFLDTQMRLGITSCMKLFSELRTHSVKLENLFGNKVRAGVIVDRIVHHATLIYIDGHSYRAKNSLI